MLTRTITYDEQSYEVPKWQPSTTIFCWWQKDTTMKILVQWNYTTYHDFYHHRRRRRHHHLRPRWRHRCHHLRYPAWSSESHVGHCRLQLQCQFLLCCCVAVHLDVLKTNNITGWPTHHLSEYDMLRFNNVPKNWHKPTGKDLWKKSLAWNETVKKREMTVMILIMNQSNILYSTACDQKHLRLTITHIHTKLHQLLISDFSVFSQADGHTKTQTEGNNSWQTG